jgi:hypothetical protein
MMAPASASTTYAGAVKFGWTITSSFTAHLASNYKTGQAAFATGTGTIQQSAGTGTCTLLAADAFNSYTLQFGNITPGAATMGCNYQNAIGMSILTNDTNGYLVYETLDTTVAPTTYGVCIFADSAVPSALTPVSTNGAAPAAGTFGATLTSCAGTGQVLGVAPGAVVNPGVGGDEALTTAPPTGAYTLSTPVATSIFGAAAIIPATTTTTYFLGEDVQLNIPTSAASGTFAHAVIVYFLPQ